ncbi:MAG TPA: hypothetical protein VEG29_00120 [Candidatus Binatia bacterium]|jgi:hypothetical protein|nr:hypothetical protein [Candidatus Binatia bacterium]
MALQQPTTAGSALESPILRAILIVAAIVVAMLALTAILGVGQAGPGYQIVPDPAAGMGLPF